MKATLTISSEDKKHAGSYSLHLIEKDTAVLGDAKFTTKLAIILVDYCSTAKVLMGSPTSEISYIAQSGPKEIDLSEAQNNFAVDSDHKEACSPIRFSYTAQGEGDFNPDWVTIDQASGSVVVEVGQLS